jgi:hypothetical protein
MRRLFALTATTIVALYYAYHTARLTLLPPLPSGDDAILHISYCLYEGVDQYLHGPSQYPNFIHLTCHLAAAGNPIYAIWFIKIFAFAAAFIPIALLLYEISKKDPKIAIPLAAGLAAYGTGYLRTLADGSIFNLFSHGMYLASLIFLHNQKPLLAGVAAGLALTHYYGIVYLATLLPAVMLQCGRRRFLYGVAVGFLPTAPKWVTLALTIKKSGAAAVGTAEPPAWAIQDWLNYAYTPDLRWGDAAFYAYVAAAAVLALAAKERKILATATSPALYVAGTLTAAFLPWLHSVAVLNLAYRLYRLLPTVVILLIAILSTNAEKKPATLAAILLATAALYGLVSSNPTPHGLYRIDYDALKTLLDLSHEICNDGVVATGQTATYMKIVCPNTLLIYPPKILDAMAADDPEAAEARRILAQIQNGTIHGYSWLVVQEPVPGQWYDEAVATFVQQLKDQIYILGDVKYVIKNQGATIYIVKIR